MGGSVSTSPRTSKLPQPPMETTIDSFLPISKLLFNVSIHNSLGIIQVLMFPEDTVLDLIKAALLIYDRDKRRPFLTDTDPKGYNLHYSSFDLKGLNPNEKLKNLGSRNFFICSKIHSSLLARPCMANSEV